MNYPHNLLNDIGIELETLPNDFYPTLHYILQTIADKRDARIILMRYRDGKSYEEIGNEYSLSRQRVNVIIDGLIRKMQTQENRDKLIYGMKEYMEVVLQSRVNQLGSMLAKSEREELIKNAYDRGYQNGIKDSKTGRADNKADLDSVRALPVNRLPFSVRSFNCFSRNEISTLGDIIDKGDKLTSIKGFGITCFKEVVNILSTYNVDVKSVYPRTLIKFDMEG